MLSREKSIYILWLIREYGPINNTELLSLIEGSDVVTSKVEPIITGIIRLLTPIGTNRRPGNRVLRQYVDNMTVELVKAGLVSKSGLRNPKYSISEQYEHIIQLFGISLSSYISDGESVQPILSNPIWGLPETSDIDVFVIMPFREELQAVFDENIKVSVTDLGLSCIRGDDSFSTTSIMNDVWSSIYHSTLCIADCTGKNPNVFYELGIAHTLGRKTILIAQSIDDIPFDIQHIRVIIYDITPKGLQAFEDKLRKTIVSELGLDADV